MRRSYIWFLWLAIAGLLFGCTMHKQPDTAGLGHQESASLKLKSIQDMKKAALQGRMKEIKMPLGSTFQEIAQTYGEPEGISNEECWTYSYGHTRTEGAFYFHHDSCSDGLNVLKPETTLNKISVTAKFLQIRMTAEDVKLALGNPDIEYVGEAYGGYYLIYNLAPYQLIFIADEHSETKSIHKVNVTRINEKQS